MRKVVRATIAGSEIAGALVGYALRYSYIWPRYGGVGSPALLLYFSFIGLSLAAGLFLWRDEPRGIGLSFLALLPQVFASQNPAWGYSLQAGPQVLLLFRPNVATAWFGFQGSIETTPVAADKTYVALNFWPIVAMLGLVWLWRTKAHTMLPSTIPPSTDRAA
jgi:hypothetical protein